MIRADKIREGYSRLRVGFECNRFRKRLKDFFDDVTVQKRKENDISHDEIIPHKQDDEQL